MKWIRAAALVLVPWLGPVPVALAEDGGSGEAAPAATAAGPSLDQGWDRDVGLLLSLRNPFQNAGFLAGYRDYGVGMLLAFRPTLALRAAVDLSRASDPYYEVTSEVERPDGSTDTTSAMVNGSDGPTSAARVRLGADLLVRGSEAAIAPYFGAGLSLVLDVSATRYTDVVSIEGLSAVVDDQGTSFATVLGGVLGIEWRVHDHFSLFAEYGLGLEVVSLYSLENQTTIEDGRGEGVETTVYRISASQTRWLNLDAGLDQGATLGVIAFF